jgi:hypothetical protein
MAILILLFCLLVNHVCGAPSTSCASFQVVPGSKYDTAYLTKPYNNRVFYSYDVNFCRNNVHPNSTYPVFRDDLTADYVSRIDQYNWIGLYQTYTGVYNASAFVWGDGVSGAVRVPDWYLNDSVLPSPDYSGSRRCAIDRPGGTLLSVGCGGNQPVLCELPSKPTWGEIVC